MSKENQIAKINKEILNLKISPLYLERIKNGVLPVFGEGSLDAKIIFVGEAPGKNEAEKGKPFCGVSGKVLDQILEFAGIKRNDVYITNIVKDRPPQNRNPTKVEISLYGPFLNKEIAIIGPKIIFTLGHFSMEYVMTAFGLGDKIKPIGKVHGKIFRARRNLGNIIVVPLYHPAVVVYNSIRIDVLKADLRAVLAKLPESHLI
jgi:uracil-DNA glycosylase family 4